MLMPAGIYGRVAPKSRLTVKRNIDIKAGVIGIDYRGKLTIVVIHNMGETRHDFKSFGTL